MIDQRRLSNNGSFVPPPSSNGQPQRVKKVFPVGIAVVVALVAGVGAFAYLSYFKKSPEVVMNEMRTRLAEVESVEYAEQIAAESTIPGFAEQGSEFLITLSGKSHLQEVDDPRSRMSLTVETDAFRPSNEGKTIFSLEMRRVGQATYLKLIGLSNGPDMLDLGFLKDQWIEVDAEDLRNTLSGTSDGDQTSQPQTRQELSFQQVVKEGSAVLGRAEILKVTGILPGDTVEGVDTYHYAVRVDKEELSALILELRDILGESPATAEERADLEERLQAVNFTDGEIWIGKKDSLPRRVSISLTAAESEDGQSMAGTAGMVFTFRGYNEPVDVEAPSDARDIQEVLMDLFGGLLGGQIQLGAPSFAQ